MTNTYLERKLFLKLADHEIPIGTNRVAAVKQIFLSALD